MPSSASVLPAPFERVAAASEPSAAGLDAAAQSLVVQVPLRARVLEIGCGTGMLARELATRRGARVTAIDVSDRMIDVARVRTSATLGIEYRVADFLELSPRGFDVVIAADTLHALPFANAVARMADAVAPGGTLLIADTFSTRGVAGLPYTALCWFARASRPVADGPSLHAIRRELRALLPGVHVRRHLGWRYTARWTRDCAGPLPP